MRAKETTMTVTTKMAKEVDREQAREKVNTQRFMGGLALVMGLLFYFFHLAEVPMGRHGLGVAAAVFGVIGVALLWVGQRGIRALR